MTTYLEAAGIERAESTNGQRFEQRDYAMHSVKDRNLNRVDCLFNRIKPLLKILTYY